MFILIGIWVQNKPSKMKRQLFIVLLTIASAGVCVSQSISVVNPSSASQGDNLSVDISGVNTNFNMASTTVQFEQGTSTVIYANSVTVLTQNFLQADFTFFYGHPSGFYDVKIYDDIDGWITEPNGFYLSPGGTPPEIVLVSPDNANQGQSVSVDISGMNSNFGMGTSTTPVWLTQGTSTIYSGSVILNTLTSVAAFFTIPFNASVGFWDVSVWSPLDGIVTMLNGFYIDWDPNSISHPKSEDVVQIEVYPNPASSFVYVESEEIIERISITNRLGQEIYNELHNDRKIRVALAGDAPAGVYLISVKTGSSIQVRKIVF